MEEQHLSYFDQIYYIDKQSLIDLLTCYKHDCEECTFKKFNQCNIDGDEFKTLD